MFGAAMLGPYKAQAALERRSLVSRAREVPTRRSTSLRLLQSELDQHRLLRLRKNRQLCRRRKARRGKQKALLKQAKTVAKSSSEKHKDREAKASRDSSVPEREWSKIMSFTYSGKRRWAWYSCLLGCTSAARSTSAFSVSGSDQPYHGNR